MQFRTYFPAILLPLICLSSVSCGEPAAENLAPNPDPPAETGRDFN